jgi:tRNA dimethylallyltransferase
MAIKLLVLTGPTAVGKTALAIQWAQALGGEIINADSRQVYRHMDIGTAKPSLAEQASVPHHLLDVVAPDQAFSLAEYQKAAAERIQEIHHRAKLPILVGGTGLYLTALIEAWQIPEVPPNPELRARLEATPLADLVAQLGELDPAAAAFLDLQNGRRVIRALEVTLLSGRPFSALRQKQAPLYDARCMVLDMPREALYARADARVGQMVAAGWPEEVRHLIQDLGYDPGLPSFSALGYPQMAALLRGEMNEGQAITAIQHATHSFIRRQYTWIRGHVPPGGWHFISPAEDGLEGLKLWLSGEA